MVELKIKRTADIDMPVYENQDDAGLDIRSKESITIGPNEQKLIPSGIHLEIPKGHVGLIWDKSGFGAKGLHTFAGVIDSGYRGEIKVVIKNFSDESVLIEKNMKIAQLLIQPIVRPTIVEVETLSDSDRGTGGFGSTGAF